MISCGFKLSAVIRAQKDVMNMQVVDEAVLSAVHHRKVGTTY